MKSTQVGVGAIRTGREQRPELKTKLDEDLPVNPEPKKPTVEIINGRPVFRTQSGYVKS